MKILGGTHKGRNFYMPHGIRPTQNMLREAVFDILGHDLSGMTFLELFAGSGSMSLEAISRGAKSAVMVEHDLKNVKVIKENLEIMGIGLPHPNYEVFHMDAFAAIKFLARQKRKFDIMFFDPPYGLKLAKKTLNLLGTYDILQPHCFIAVEYDKTETLPELGGRFFIVTERKYGTSYLTIYEGRPQPESENESVQQKGDLSG